jgi:hypothetical protein
MLEIRPVIIQERWLFFIDNIRRYIDDDIWLNVVDVEWGY